MVRFSFFKHGDKSKVRESQLRGAVARRTPALRKAWGESEEIKALYDNGMSVDGISKLYNIHPRSCYRIIKS